ncbi:MAG: hypothetical protein ACTHJT_12650 [Cytophaga sp.]|uniref:hypothetical protein n=1 Tax=Cytophaga sp. TaxID=29535 RepID=UPI003F7D5930
MAKVAKKSASSAKKGAAAPKGAVKKTDKQKKAPVKVASTASKKKATSKPVVKKAAPAKKAAVKKVVAKKSVKPAAPAKKAVAKKAAPAKAVSKGKPVPAKKAPAKAAVKVAPKAVPAKKTAPAKPAPAAKVDKSAKTKPAAAVKAAPKAEPKDPKKAVMSSETAADMAARAMAKPQPPRRKKKKNDDDDDDEEEVVFRKPVKTPKTSAVKKASAKYVSEELTLEGPAPKRIGAINMTSEEKIKLKKALLNRCIDIQKNAVSIAKKAMEEALTSANAEKVSEELSDSFRESMHATRDMYARQANEGVNNLGLLNRINIVEHDKVKFGSVVFTNFQNYFISTGLGEIKVDDMSFQAVSTLAPLFQILVDKKKGDTFMFLDRLYTVVEVF